MTKYASPKKPVTMHTTYDDIKPLSSDESNGGIDAVNEFKKNINSDNARRKVDGRTEVRLIELACEPVPEGHSR